MGIKSIFFSQVSKRPQLISPTNDLLSFNTYSICNISKKKVNLGLDISCISSDAMTGKYKRRFDSGSIASKIRTTREKLGLTSKQLAEKAKVSDRMIWKYENQRISENAYSTDILCAIAKAMGLDEKSFFNEYHIWLTTTAYQDVQMLIAARTESIDNLAKKCHTTHCSLYHWRDGVGKPNIETYELVCQQKNHIV